MASSRVYCPPSKPWACRMPLGACIRKQGNSRIQLPTMHPQPELTDGLSTTACFQMSAQLQSQISSFQTIMGWQSQCHLPMHPPRGLGLWSMPPAIISHPAFKTLMTAQIQTFLHANPVTTTLSRAARWDQLKVHIQDAARGYCFTFHAQRAGQLRVLRVRASKARAAYVAAPGSQHALDELRRTAAALLQHRSRRAKVQSRASHLMSCKQLSSCLLGARSQIAQASQPAQPSDTSDSDAILASSPSSQQVSLSSSSTSRHGHLARQLALKTVKAMIHNDWTKCNDKIKQISGVCSNWLRGKDPSMTLAAFKSLWCHSGILASVTSPSGDVDGWLEPGCQPILVLCD